MTLKWTKKSEEQLDTLRLEVDSNPEKFKDIDLQKEIINKQDIPSLKIVFSQIIPTLEIIDYLVKSGIPSVANEFIEEQVKRLGITKEDFTKIVCKKEISSHLICEVLRSIPGQIEYKCLPDLIEICANSEDDFLVLEYISRNKIVPEWMSGGSFLVLKPETVIYLIAKKHIDTGTPGRGYSGSGRSFLHSYISGLPLSQGEYVLKELYELIGLKVNTETIDAAIKCKNIPFLKKYLKASHLKTNDRIKEIKQAGLASELSELIQKARIDLYDSEDVFESGDDDLILRMMTEKRSCKRGPKSSPTVSISARLKESKNNSESVEICLKDFANFSKPIQVKVFKLALDKSAYNNELVNNYGDEKLTLFGQLLKSYVEEDFSAFDNRVKKILSDKEFKSASDLSWSIIHTADELGLSHIVDTIDKKIAKINSEELASKVDPRFAKTFLLNFKPTEDSNRFTPDRYLSALADLVDSETLDLNFLMSEIKKHKKYMDDQGSSRSWGHGPYGSILEKLEWETKLDLCLLSESELGKTNDLIEGLVSDMTKYSHYSFKDNFIKYSESRNFSKLERLIKIFSKYPDFATHLEYYVLSIAENDSEINLLLKKKFPKYFKINKEDKKDTLSNLAYKYRNLFTEVKRADVNIAKGKFVFKLSDEQVKILDKIVNEGTLCPFLSTGEYTTDEHKFVPYKKGQYEYSFEIETLTKVALYVRFGDEIWSGALFKFETYGDLLKLIKKRNFNTDEIDEAIHDLRLLKFEDESPESVYRAIKKISELYELSLNESFKKLIQLLDLKSYHNSRDDEYLLRQVIQTHPELLSIPNISSFDPIYSEIDPLLLNKKDSFSTDEILSDVLSKEVRLSDYIDSHNVRVSDLPSRLMPDFNEKDRKDFLKVLKRINNFDEEKILNPEDTFKVPMLRQNKNVSELFKKRVINGVGGKYLTLMNLLIKARPEEFDFHKTTLKDGVSRIEQGFPFEKILSKDIGLKINPDIGQISKKDLDYFLETSVPNITTERMITFFKDTYLSEITDTIGIYLKMSKMSDEKINEKFQMPREALKNYIHVECSKKKNAEGVHDFIQMLAEYIDKENVPFEKEQSFLAPISGKEFTGGYKLFIPKETNDLIRIGQELNNCVGKNDYDLEIIKGESIVLLLEAKKEKICVEFKNKNNRYIISQARTNNNKDRSDLDCIGELLSEVNRLNDYNLKAA